MKSYFKEIKSINHSNALKQAQSLLHNSIQVIDSNTFNSPSSAKAHESLRVKTDPYDSSLEQQPANTWRGMSFNVPSNVIKVPEFVGFSRTKKNDGQVILTQRSDNTRASTATSASARISSPRFTNFPSPVQAADNEGHNHNIASFSQRTNYQPSVPSSTKSQHSNYSRQSVNLSNTQQGGNKELHYNNNPKQIIMKSKNTDTVSEQITLESSKESYFPISRHHQIKEISRKSNKETAYNSKSTSNTPDIVYSPKAQLLLNNIELHSFMKNQMHQFCLNASQENDNKKHITDTANANQNEKSIIINNKSSQHNDLRHSEKHSSSKNEYFSKNNVQEELINSQQSHRMYSNRMYKIQKAAVSAYLNGEGVEKKVIDCHLEIVHPLAQYIQQKKRDQRMEQLKQQNDFTSKNSPSVPVVSPDHPIISHEQLVKTQLYSNSMPKGCLKGKKCNNSKPFANNSVNSSQQQQLQPSQQLSSKIQNKISEIMATQTHEQSKESGTPASFWQSFLKGEKDYFQKLGQLQQIGFINFEKSMKSMHKFHYDYLSNPEAQFLSCNDLSTTKSVQILCQFQRQLKNNLQDEEAARQLTNKRNKEIRRKNKRSCSSYNRTLDNNRNILSRQSSKLSHRCNSTEIEPKDQQQQQQLKLQSPQRTQTHSLFKQAHNSTNLHRSNSSNICDTDQTQNNQEQILDSCKEEHREQLQTDRFQWHSREHSNDNSILKDQQYKQQQSFQKTASSKKIAFNLQKELGQEEQEDKKLNDTNCNLLVCSLQCPSPKKYQSKNRHKFEKMLHQFESKETMKNRIIQGERAMQADFEESIDHMERAVQEMEDNYQVLANIQPLTQVERECFSFAKNNNFTELQAYIKANKHIIYLRDETGKTLLHWAALRGNLEVVDLLCKSQAQLNVVDSANKKPKDLALQQGCSSTYSLLVKEERFLQRTSSRRLLLSQPSGISSSANSNH